MSVPVSLLVPVERLPRWTDNFTTRRGATSLAVVMGALVGEAEDGSRFTARLPFSQVYAGPPDAAAFAGSVSAPDRWGVLLVRKGGFAVARLDHETMVESKVGQRHVQGRTKAGGQSQQRFARRRANQARQAYEAAADHAARILAGTVTVVTGGDRSAVEEVLADSRLAGVSPEPRWLAVPDPRRGVLEQAVADALAIGVEVTNAGE